MHGVFLLDLTTSVWVDSAWPEVGALAKVPMMGAALAKLSP